VEEPLLSHVTLASSNSTDKVKGVESYSSNDDIALGDTYSDDGQHQLLLKVEPGSSPVCGSIQSQQTPV